MGLNHFQFLIIVLFSFICDLDVFFTKYARDHNHRNLISHSIIPSILILVIGIFFNWNVLIIASIAYAFHIIIDTFDWGTNFFYFNQKTIGFRLLITKEEEENLEKFLSEFKVRASFFDFKYYNSRVSIGLEIILFFLMVFFQILFALEYIYILPIYFFFLYFHLSRHSRLKKVEERNIKSDN
ncbi:MAG: hypothetical protein GF317_12960 [Candidatus Lokiarchaeota archaeon]|nr:hypothetical protein [Candidatus Lokiarchaeota archaeon]MBD3200551.1 hypothetical protein [Candidatus Lokiarchaeota archaeon]